MHSRQQNTFQSDSPFTIPCKRALSTPTPHLTLLYWAPFRPDFQQMHCEFLKKNKVLKSKGYKCSSFPKPLTYVVNVYSDMSLSKGHLGSRGAKHLKII